MADAQACVSDEISGFCAKIFLCTDKSALKRLWEKRDTNILFRSISITCMLAAHRVRVAIKAKESPRNLIPYKFVFLAAT